MSHALAIELKLVILALIVGSIVACLWSGLTRNPDRAHMLQSMGTLGAANAFLAVAVGSYFGWLP